MMGVDGFGWLVAGVIVAGLVRGFSGFGTAMIYLPIAGQVLSPVAAITTLIVIDLIGPLPNVPRALREAVLPDVARLGIGLVLGLPVGVAVLLAVAPEVFRYAVSGATLVMLGLLLAGWRYAGPLRAPLVLATGGASGLLGGAAGLAGPPVILVYMASPLRPAAIRANILLFLLVTDIAMLGLYALWDVFDRSVAMAGLVLAVPYLLANVAGAAMFRPEAERTYRRIAYAIIAGSALLGLPLWD
ncbi:MAG: Sulfite exporter TauE/SafE [Rhodobacteraceae bacterium HLUCCA08]|nr:MAG: Sulfite exporter TauE/SafE [Rhodobacteraceae bacterium HLUCCA08]